MTPKLVVYSWKKLQVFKKGFFLKKCFQLITGDKIFKTVCGSISRDVLTFDDFKVTKFALYKKIKYERQKNKETSRIVLETSISQIIS